MVNRILRTMLDSEKYFQVISPVIGRYKKDLLLESWSGKLFDILVDRNSKYHPTISDIDVVVLSDTSSGGKVMRNKFNELKDLDCDLDIDEFIIVTLKWVKDTLTISNAIELVQKLDKGQDASRERAIFDEIAELTVKNTRVVSFDDHERVEDYKSDKISTGYDVLDTIMDGGPLKISLTVLIAMVGTGKTQFKIDAACQGFLANKNILVLSGEMSAKAMWKRADSNLLKTVGSELEKIKKEDYKTVLQAVRKHYGITADMKMLRVPTNGYSATDLRNELKRFKNTDGFVPDIIYIDSWNLMAPNNKRMDINSSHTYFSAVIKEFRDVSGDYEVPLIGSIHVSPTEVNNIMAGKEINQYCSSEYKQLCRDADFVAGLCEIYYKDGYYYKDTIHTKPIEEELIGNYRHIFKVNTCKTRFAGNTRIGDYAYLKSDPTICEFKLVKDDKNRVVNNKVIAKAIEEHKRKKAIKEKILLEQYREEHPEIQQVPVEVISDQIKSDPLMNQQDDEEDWDDSEFDGDWSGGFALGKI